MSSPKMGIITIVKDTCLFILHTSIHIGQLIVLVVNALIWGSVSFFVNILAVFEVISTDFAIFVEDVIDRIHYGTSLVTEMAFGTCSKITELIDITISFVINMIINAEEILKAALNVIFDGVQGIGNTFVFIKYCLMLFGRSVWLVITFIPSTLLYAVSSTIEFVQIVPEMIVKYLKQKLESIQSLWGDFYDFLTDVPLESIMGLLTITGLIYFFTRFYAILSAYLRQRVRSLVNDVNCSVRKWKGAFIRWQIEQKSRPPPPPTHYETNKEGSGDQFCVICQERSKCILLLPCRHLCLCRECTRTLRLYNNSCPICRIDVERTMKVYI